MAERPTSDPDNRVIDIQSGRNAPRHPRAVTSLPAGTPGSDDLQDFARGHEPDDFRHRMVTNVIAFIFVAALVGAGLWLADSLARMRKNQDCVLSGKRGCTPVEAPISTR